MKGSRLLILGLLIVAILGLFYPVSYLKNQKIKDLRIKYKQKITDNENLQQVVDGLTNKVKSLKQTIVDLTAIVGSEQATSLELGKLLLEKETFEINELKKIIESEQATSFELGKLYLEKEKERAAQRRANEAETKSSSEKIKSLEKENADVNESVATLKTQLASKQNQVKDLERDLLQNEDKLDAARRTKEEEIRSTLEKIEELEKKLAESSLKAAGLASELSEAQNLAKELQAVQSQKENKFSEKLLAKQAEIESAHDKIKSLEKVNADVNKTVAMLKTQLAIEQNQIKESAVSYQKLEIELAQAKQKLANALADLENKTAELDKTIGEVKAGQNRIDLLTKAVQDDKEKLALRRSLTDQYIIMAMAAKGFPLGTVHFKIGKAELTPAGDAILQRVSDEITKYQGRGFKLRISGHADTLRFISKHYSRNTLLSVDRAKNVFIALCKKAESMGIPVVLVAHGEYQDAERKVDIAIIPEKEFDIQKAFQNLKD